MKKLVLDAIRKIHHPLVAGRNNALSSLIAELLPDTGNVLDIGCGNGYVDRQIMDKKRMIRIVGIDVYKQANALISVKLYDGHKIPFPDSYFDCVLIVDALHHMDDPSEILKEARRVTKKYVIIKDHLAENGMDRKILKFMDWIGNRPYGVRLPYNYWKESKWRAEWKSLGLSVSKFTKKVNLYPAPLNLVFGRSLHFVARLDKKAR